jgi:hypothetical protein
MVSNVLLMRGSVIVGLILVCGAASILGAEEKPKTPADNIAKRCAPKIVRETPRHTGGPTPIHFRPGEKMIHTPVIRSQILESGEVVNVRVNQSSGVADIDQIALDSVRFIRYNKRPGCPVMESEAAVTVDFW